MMKPWQESKIVIPEMHSHPSGKWENVRILTKSVHVLVLSSFMQKWQVWNQRGEVPRNQKRGCVWFKEQQRSSTPRWSHANVKYRVMEPTKVSRGKTISKVKTAYRQILGRLEIFFSTSCVDFWESTGTEYKWRHRKPYLNQWRVENSVGYRATSSPFGSGSIPRFCFAIVNCFRQ